MRHWRFHPGDGRLVSADRVETLTPKAAAVLALLLARKGETVSREEVLDAVWGGLSVSPDLVREYVFDIRAALGDEAAARRYVETVRGRGFRLVGPVTFAEGAPDADPRATVAVLRPSVFAGEARWRHLADGLAEDITTDLARFPEIAVIARHSAFAATREDCDLRQIAQDLRADYVLESSLAPAARHLRATFQLIRGADGVHAWAKRDDVPLERLQTVSGTLAEVVANALGGWSGAVHAAEQARLRRRPAASLAAYEHFLLCIHHEHGIDADSARLAIEHGRRAVEFDPDLARGWLMLALLYAREEARPFFPDDAARLAAREDAMRRALAADPADPMVLGEAAFAAALRGEMARAADLAARAEDLGRNQADVSMLLASAFALLFGDASRARALLDRADRLTPMRPPWFAGVEARVAFVEGDFDRCMRLGREMPEVLTTALFGTPATALTAPPATVRDARAAFVAQFPDFDADAYAKDFPIAVPPVLDRFHAAAARLHAA